jgi:16S rRNA (guanine527-N7)-methyltransferase
VSLPETLSPLGLSLRPEQLVRLERFEGLVGEHGERLGLVSPGDLQVLRDRHILDSLRAVRAFRGDERRACDLGSGAGFPGVPLAIAAEGCRFVLCEPRRRRAGFLELVVERLGLGNAEVFAGRAEDLPDQAFDLCTARAFGPLGRSWKAAWPLLAPGGRLVYFAGRSFEEAETAARSLSDPAPPSSVELLEVLANSPPLVIMAREVTAHGDP